MERKILGIDIGGTNIRGAIVNENGKVTNREKISSDAKEGIGKLVKNLTGFIELFNIHKPDAVGIGVPGIIDQKKGILTQAPNIKGVENFPVYSELNKKIKIPFIIENDANCAALGEFWKGAGKNSNSIVMLTIGTGLGGGIILNGDLWRGEDGMGGEVGHIIVNPKGPECNCGSNGCLESYVSAEALKREINSHETLKKLLAKTPINDKPENLMKLALNGNKMAHEIWKEMGRWLGIGIVTITNLLNVETVIIGGGISNGWSLFINETLSEIKKRGLKAPAKRLKVKKTELGDNAGTIGSSYLAIKHLENL